jgi:hypothetical protein
MKKIILISTLLLTQLSSLFSQTEIECDEFSYIIDSNLILVKKGSDFGIIDISGKLMIDYTIKSPEIDGNILICEKIADKGLGSSPEVELINLKTLKPIWSGEVSKTHVSKDNYIHIYNFGFSDLSTKSFIMNSEGIKLFDLPKNTNNIKYGETFTVSEDIIKVPIKDRNSNPEEYYIYLDLKGNKINDSTFIYAKDFHNGLAKTGIYKHGKLYWGFINNKGETIIDYKFTNEPTSFSDNLARVKSTNGQYGFINKKGEIVIEPKYSFATGFYQGFALVKENYNSTFQLINTKSETIKNYPNIRDIRGKNESEQSIIAIKELIDERILVTNTDNTIIDFEGNIILKEKGLNVNEFNFGLAKFQKYNFETGKTIYGIMNNKGEVILIKKENQF